MPVITDIRSQLSKTNTDLTLPKEGCNKKYIGGRSGGGGNKKGYFTYKMVVIGEYTYYSWNNKRPKVVNRQFSKRQIIGKVIVEGAKRYKVSSLETITRYYY